MSGTSLDGHDLVLAKFVFAESKWSFEILAKHHVPYSNKEAQQLASLMQADAWTLMKTEADWSHRLGQEMQAFIRSTGLRPDVAGCHGHTIFHRPSEGVTTQIIDGEIIATYLDCQIVTRFRNKDVGFGGQGAPLVPVSEQLLFPDISGFVNLGGIANISTSSVGSDLAPCNQVFNALTRMINPSLPFDEDGRIMSEGNLQPDLAAQLRKWTFFHRPFPKSLGAEDLPGLMQHLMAGSYTIPDRMFTYAVVLAETLAAALVGHGARGNILVTGGGLHHPGLRKQIRMAFEHQGLRLQEADPALVDYKEALIFAFLGVLRIIGIPATDQDRTGARKASVAGVISHGQGQDL